MTERHVVGELSIDVPAGFQVRAVPAQAARTGRGRGTGGRMPLGPVPLAAAGPVDPVPGLLEQGFEVVGDRPMITAAAGITTRSGGRRTIPIRAVVNADEDALLLLEQDGVYSWHTPARHGEVTPPPPGARGALRRTRGTRELTFELPIDPSRGGTAERRGLLAHLALAAVRVTVLKFVARKLTDHVVEHLESHIETRLLAITAPDPTTWSTLGAPALPSGRTPRVLLFLHGTFSSTAGAFGSLAGHRDGRAFLDAAIEHYDLVLGYEHRTLSLDPTQNAIDLLSRLRAIAWPAPPRIDVITHSRGTLVARSLFEEVLPQSGWPVHLDKTVFVAGPNAGTELARPDKWGAMLDLYTNLAAAAARLVPEQLAATLMSAAIRGLGALAKGVLSYAISEGGAPGLAAMQPGGDWVSILNRAQPGQPVPGTTLWYVVASDFEPGTTGPQAPALPARLLQFVADHVVDREMGEANDLVVNTSSMSAIDNAGSGFIVGRKDFGPSDGVFHTSYFTRPACAQFLLDTLLGAALLGDSAAVAPRGRYVRHRRKAAAGRAGAPDLHSPRHLSAPGASGRAVLPGLPAGTRHISPPGRPSARRARPTRTAARTGTPARAAAAPSATANVRAAMAAQALVGRPTTVTCTLGRGELPVPGAGQITDAASTAIDITRKITVQVIGKANVAVGDPDRVDVDLPGDDTPLELYFDITPLAEGQGEVRVIARQGPVPLVTLVLTPTFVTRLSGGPVGNVGAAIERAPTQPPQTCVKQWLRITEQQIGTETQYAFEIQSDDPQLLFKATSAPLRGGREAYVDQLYQRIESRWVGSHGDAVAFSRELRELGGELFDELIPPELGRLLWRHRTRLKDVLVLSDEPFIPWELVHLKNGRTLPNRSWFLADLGLMRWLQVNYPPASLRHDKVRYVVPQYPPGSGYELDATQAEANFLRTELGGRAIRPDAASVVAALRRPGSFDVLHFAGHGATDGSTAQLLMTGSIQNSDGQQVYNPEFVTDTTVTQQAELKAADGSQPVIVLNACQVGRRVPKLTSMGGFAQAFIEAGAGAFVGTLWSVGDQPADVFTEELYRQLLDHRTLAEATVAARTKARRGATDATWLAYVVYGNPCARFD